MAALLPAGPPAPADDEAFRAGVKAVPKDERLAAIRATGKAAWVAMTWQQRLAVLRPAPPPAEDDAAAAAAAAAEEEEDDDDDRMCVDEPAHRIAAAHRAAAGDAEEEAAAARPDGGTLVVPSPECPDVDALCALLMDKGGLTWYERGTNFTVEIAEGEHALDHLATDADGNSFTGVHLTGPCYEGLTIRGAGMDKTTLRGGLILINGRDTSGIRLQDFALSNPDQAGWLRWMKNGLYVDDGAHDVRVTRCRLFECEKFGVFVGDNASHVVLDDCVLSGNLKGGLIASEGGVAEVMGLQTAACDNGGFGIFAYMAPSVVRLHFPGNGPLPVSVNITGNKKGDQGSVRGGTVVRVESLLENAGGGAVPLLK